MSGWLQVLAGGAIGFGAAVFADLMRRRYFSPSLDLEYNESEGSKLWTTGTLKTGSEVELCYVRVKVTNSSFTRTMARKCLASIAQIEKKGRDGDSAATFHDNIPLCWSYRKSKERLDIPHGVSVFFDVFFTKEGSDQFYWRFADDGPRHYGSLTNQKVEFLLTVLVASENGPPTRLRLRFKWNGDWKDFEIQPLTG